MREQLKTREACRRHDSGGFMRTTIGIEALDLVSQMAANIRRVSQSTGSEKPLRSRSTEIQTEQPGSTVTDRGDRPVQTTAPAPARRPARPAHVDDRTKHRLGLTYERMVAVAGGIAKKTQMQQAAAVTKEVAETAPSRPAMASFDPAQVNDPVRQVAMLQIISRQFGWEYSHADFQDAMDRVPRGPFGPNQVPVLVPYISRHPVATMERLLRAIETLHGGLYRTVRFEKSWEKVEVDSGIEHRACLGWEVLDLGVDSPAGPISHHTAPHLAILAAALVHPKLIKQLGVSLPPVALSGYLLASSGDNDSETRPCRPTLSFHQGVGLLRLGTTFDLCPDKTYAYPRVVRVC